MDRGPGVLRMARAIFSLALVGAAIGLVLAPLANVLWWMFPLPCEVPLFGSRYWGFALLSALPYSAGGWALLGGLTGGSFGTLLLVTREKRSLEEFSTLKVGAFGGLAGAMFWPVHNTLMGYSAWLIYPESFVPLAVTGLLGAGLTTGMVTLAKHASPRALSPYEEFHEQIAAAVPMDS